MLLTYVLVSDVVSIVLALNSVENIFLFHIYLVVAYPSIAVLFSLWHSGNTRQTMRWSIPFFLVAYLLFLVFGDGNLERPPGHSLALMSIFCTGLALYTLIGLATSSSTNLVYKDERFWVSFGIILSYGVTSMIYSGIRGGVTRDLWILHNSIQTIGNFCFLGGYLSLSSQVDSLLNPS